MALTCIAVEGAVGLRVGEKSQDRPAGTLHRTSRRKTRRQRKLDTYVMVSIPLGMPQRTHSRVHTKAAEQNKASSPKNAVRVVYRL